MAGNGKQSVTVDGVEVEFDKSKLADMRFVNMIGDLGDESLDDAEKMAVMAHLMRFLFGSDRYRVQDCIAESNGGMLDGETFGTWLKSFLEAVNAKN